ncbi:MAG: hypothetical protein RIM80_03120, partial [Alphaproteobacteria bacterium]
GPKASAEEREEVRRLSRERYAAPIGASKPTDEPPPEEAPPDDTPPDDRSPDSGSPEDSPGGARKTDGTEAASSW